jgi:hypothetical protein
MDAAQDLPRSLRRLSITVGDLLMYSAVSRPRSPESSRTFDTWSIMRTTRECSICIKTAVAPPIAADGLAIARQVALSGPNNPSSFA